MLGLPHRTNPQIPLSNEVFVQWLDSGEVCAPPPPPHTHTHTHTLYPPALLSLDGGCFMFLCMCAHVCMYVQIYQKLVPLHVQLKIQQLVFLCDHQLVQTCSIGEMNVLKINQRYK